MSKPAPKHPDPKNPPHSTPPTDSTTSASSEEGVTILDSDAIRRSLKRIAHEIVEYHADCGPSHLILAGIPTRGSELARRLSELIREIEGSAPPFGSLDISMYRDDLSRRPLPPKVHATDLPFGIDGSTVVLIDDVIQSGRTVRAALDAITALGRPARIQLAVLVDRGHREIPIRPDYIGKNLPTSRSEKVRVRLAPIDGDTDSVRLAKTGGGE